MKKLPHLLAPLAAAFLASCGDDSADDLPRIDAIINTPPSKERQAEIRQAIDEWQAKEAQRREQALQEVKEQSLGGEGKIIINDSGIVTIFSGPASIPAIVPLERPDLSAQNIHILAETIGMDVKAATDHYMSRILGTPEPFFNTSGTVMILDFEEDQACVGDQNELMDCLNISELPAGNEDVRTARMGYQLLTAPIGRQGPQ